MELFEKVSEDIINTIKPDDIPQIRKFLFMTPIEKTSKNENFFDFCGVEWQWGRYQKTKNSSTGTL